MNITGTVVMNARANRSGMIDLVSSNKWEVTSVGNKQTTLKPTNGKFNNYGIHLKNAELHCSNVLDNIGTTEDCTVCMWVNSADANKGIIYIGGEHDASAPICLVLCFNRYDAGGGFACAGYVPTYVGPVYSANAWHHVTFTRSNGTSYFFQDGVLKWSGSFPYDILKNNYLRTDLISSGDYSKDAVYDDIVIIKGQALWTADYTLPTDYITGSISGSYSTPYYYDNTGAPLPTLNNLYLKQY